MQRSGGTACQEEGTSTCKGLEVGLVQMKYSKKAHLTDAEWAQKGELERGTERQARARALSKEFGLSVSCKAVGGS